MKEERPGFDEGVSMIFHKRELEVEEVNDVQDRFLSFPSLHSLKESDHQWEKHVRASVPTETKLNSAGSGWELGGTTRSIKEESPDSVLSPLPKYLLGSLCLVHLVLKAVVVEVGMLIPSLSQSPVTTSLFLSVKHPYLLPCPARPVSARGCQRDRWLPAASCSGSQNKRHDFLRRAMFFFLGSSS